MHRMGPARFSSVRNFDIHLLAPNLYAVRFDRRAAARLQTDSIAQSIPPGMHRTGDRPLFDRPLMHHRNVLMGTDVAHGIDLTLDNKECYLGSVREIEARSMPW